MKRGQVFVRARNAEGEWSSVDVLDLDEASFRAFVVGTFVRAGAVTSIEPGYIEGPAIELRADPERVKP